MFAVLLACYFMVYFHRMSLGAVGPELVEEVGGSLGILSSAYFWTYAAMQVPAGLMADRFGPRACCTVFLSVATVGSLLTFAGTTFEAMIVGKVMIAAGMAVVYVPLMKLVSSWFPDRSFAELNGIVIAVGNIGAICASGPLHMLDVAVGWRNVFAVLGAATLVLAFLCLVLVRDRPEDRGLQSEKGPMEHEGKPDVIAGLARILMSGRKFWTCALAYMLVYGSIMVFQGTWATKYFDSAYSFALSASWMVSAIGVGKIASTVAVGRMASCRGFSKKRMMSVGTACYTAIWFVIAGLAGSVDSYAFWLAVCLMFGFFGGFMSLSFTQVKEWHPSSAAGTAVSAMNVFLFIGAAIGTTASGFVIGTDYGLAEFTDMWILMAAFSLAATILVLLSKECPKDA